jgi:hypothetical protein
MNENTEGSSGTGREPALELLELGPERGEWLVGSEKQQRLTGAETRR